MNKNMPFSQIPQLYWKKIYISAILVENAVKSKNGKCLQIGVMFDQFFSMWNRCSVQLDWFLPLCEKAKIEFPHLVFNPTFFWDGSALHGYKCTSNICLRICRGHRSHSSEVSVCRGLGPHPRVTSADFLTLIYLWNPSYLS